MNQREFLHYCETDRGKVELSAELFSELCDPKHLSSECDNLANKIYTLIRELEIKIENEK